MADYNLSYTASEINARLDVQDNLTSIDANKPLSANQGKVLKGLIDGMKLAIYPIGSIYTSVVSTNPSTLFGGTWTAFARGQTLVGVDTAQTEFNTVEKTGGEKTHTLLNNETPKAINIPFASAVGFGGGAVFSSTIYTNATIIDSASTIINSSGGQAHNNLQPYVTVYFWKRTA